MNEQVRQHLVAGFVLLPPHEASPLSYPAARSVESGQAEAIAVCKLGCNKDRTGSFAIPFGATATDPAVKKVLRHLKSCCTAQALKEQRRRMGELPKVRYKPKRLFGLNEIPF